jgi:hypothetical protein
VFEVKVILRNSSIGIPSNPEDENPQKYLKYPKFGTEDA